MHAELRRAMSSPLGLARVIARSFDLLAVSHGAADTQAADIVVRPHTHSLSASDFGAINSFISAGRAAAERELPDIVDAVKKLVRARTP